MPMMRRARLARAFAAAALIGAAVTLTACVSDSAGNAFGPPPTATVPPVPTVPPTPTPPPINRNQTVAVVAGTPIPGSAYADLVTQQRQFYAYQAQQQPCASVPTEQQLRTFVLNNLVDRAVTAVYAQQHAIAVTPSDVQTRYGLFEAQYGGAITLTNILRNYGYTVASFKVFLHDSLLEQKVANRVVPLPATIEEVQARHILVKTKALADRLYAQLKADPSKFAALAKKYSTDTGSASTGGELGFFPRGAMVAPFEKAAFSQPIGQIGKPVQSQFGYHIIQVEARKKVPFSSLDPTPPTQGTTPQPTQQAYYTQRQQTAFGQWLQAQRAHYHVRILINPGR